MMVSSHPPPPDFTVLLPAPLGPYALSVRYIQLSDPSRPIDPFSPNPIVYSSSSSTAAPTNPPRPILLKIFYPSGTQTTYPPPFLTKYFTRHTCEFFDRQFPFLADTIHEGARIDTPCDRNAPLLTHDMDGKEEAFPLILFSAGLGALKFVYTNTAIVLASRGYIVALMDYVGEAEVVELGDGTMIYPSKTKDHPWGREEVERWLEMRVGDVEFVLDRVRKMGVLPSIRGSGEENEDFSLDGRKVGIAGHSLGGNTAAAVMHKDSRISAGVNLDGPLRGEVVSDGVGDRPFLMMRSEQSPLDNPNRNDGWDGFWKSDNRGWKKEVVIEGTKHEDWSDCPMLWDEMGVWDKLPKEMKEDYGTIKPKRMLEIQAAYLTAFFDFAFKGVESELFEGNYSLLYPEIKFVERAGSRVKK